MLYEKCRYFLEWMLQMPMCPFSLNEGEWEKWNSNFMCVYNVNFFSAYFFLSLNFQLNFNRHTTEWKMKKLTTSVFGANKMCRHRNQTVWHEHLVYIVCSMHYWRYAILHQLRVWSVTVLDGWFVVRISRYAHVPLTVFV